MPARNKELDILRGVAIAWVLLCHFHFIHPYIPETLRHSWTGVDLFFVISGFLITRSLLKLEKAKGLGPGLLEFYKRRGFRILPTAIFWMGFCFIVSHLLPEFGSPTQNRIESLEVLTLTYNYKDPYRSHHYLSQYWSLMVEEHFYLGLGLLFILVRSGKLRALCLLGVASFSLYSRLRLSVPEGVDIQRYHRVITHLRLDSPMVGCLLAWIQPFLPRRIPRSLAFVLVPGIVLSIGIFPALIEVSSIYRWGYLFLALLSGVLVWVASLEQGLTLGKNLFTRCLEYLGERSYSIYLCHTVAIALSLTVFGKSIQASVWNFMTATVLTLILSEFSYRYVELYFVTLGKKLSVSRPKLAESL